MDALIGQKGVKYGLQVRKPEKKDAKKPLPPKPSIFGDDASDEDEDNVERQIARHAARKQNDKKVRLTKQFLSCKLFIFIFFLKSNPRSSLFSN
jgi:hypothetical protein